MEVKTALQKSIDYLSSEQALQDVAADAYWPKWDGPWWHMLLLYEMGEAKKVPQVLIQKFVQKMNQIPVKIFPIHPEDFPPGTDPFRGSPCHCQVGNVYQVLSECGVNVDQELPWIRPWFFKYQMTDGGLNCDSDAYLVKEECPSSMVGTIAAFEAVLLYTNRPYTPEEKNFLDRCAQFMMKRKLMLGSDTNYNASERESAKMWVDLCFPRFYLYDVLRGFNALTLWSEKTGGAIPKETIQDVVQLITEKFPDGRIRLGRQCYAGVGTLKLDNNEWVRGKKAELFPLLENVSEVGQVSSYLSKQWSEARRRLQTHNL